MVSNSSHKRSTGVKIIVSYSDSTLSIAILVSLLKKLAGCRMFDHLGGLKKHLLGAQKIRLLWCCLVLIKRDR